MIFSLVFGVVIVILVIVILALLYSERKEASDLGKKSKELAQLLTDGKIDQETFERLKINLEREATYRRELSALELALATKKIDQRTYERMVKELKENYLKAIQKDRT